jgi:hypothetical protein
VSFPFRCNRPTRRGEMSLGTRRRHGHDKTSKGMIPADHRMISSAILLVANKRSIRRPEVQGHFHFGGMFDRNI